MGFLKILDDDNPFTSSYVGTCSYASYEVHNHERYTFSADNWSLGVLLCFLASGESVFYDKDKPQSGMINNIFSYSKLNCVARRNRLTQILGPDHKNSRTSSLVDIIYNLLNPDETKRMNLFDCKQRLMNLQEMGHSVELPQ